MPRPQPGPARELERIAAWQRRSKYVFDDRNFTEPSRAMLRPAIVPSLPQEPLVVLRGPRPVVRNLFVEKLAFVHRESLSRFSRIQASPKRVVISESSSRHVEMDGSIEDHRDHTLGKAAVRSQRSAQLRQIVLRRPGSDDGPRVCAHDDVADAIRRKFEAQ